MRISNNIWFIALLLCVLVVPSSARAQVAPAAGFTFTHDLTLGVSGGDVSALQQFLIDSGFLKILSPTGYFGSLTRTALGEWQRVAGISPPVGFLGPLSRARINTAFALTSIESNPVPGIVAPTTTTVATTEATIAPSVAATTVAVTSVATTTTSDGSPMRLIIPELNVIADFQYNGLTPDGTMEIPTNIVDAGWYTGSSRPGEKGVAIITGHVAQIRKSVVTKPGVFYNLNELHAGDKLYVLNDKGESFTFVVRESRLYDPAADATDVFTSSDNGAHLNIITCEGTWNQDQLSYSQRLVIFTDAVR